MNEKRKMDATDVVGEVELTLQSKAKVVLTAGRKEKRKVEAEQAEVDALENVDVVGEVELTSWAKAGAKEKRKV